MSELLPGEASEPIEGQGEDALPGLRLSPARLGLAPQLLVAGAAGALLSLSLPPVAWWPLALVAPAILLWLVREARPRRGAAIGAVFGAVYFGILLYWLLRFGEMGWGALVLLSAGSIALFGLLAPMLWRRDRPVVSILGIAGLWTVIDWFRASWPLGGFSWGQLGSTQVDSPMLRLASVAGVWGLSFVTLTICGLLLLALDRWGRGGGLRAVAPVAVGVVLLVAPAAIPLPSADGPAIDVAALQVDVASMQTLSGDEEDRAVAALNADLHARLVDDPPDLAVWGEGALDPGASGDPATMASVRRTIAAVGAPTVVGAVIVDPDGERTSTLAFDATGEVVDRYDKVHLVPFGEYVPFRSVLDGRVDAIDQIPVDRIPGTDVRPLDLSGLPPIGTPICYENSFPGIERDMVRRGAQLLVLTINNASYGRTAASEQHLVMSRLRAVEDGRWVVHAAISGISAFVDPEGNVVARRGLFEPAILRETVRASTAETIYVRYGDWVPWGSMLLVAIAFATPRRDRRPARIPAPLVEDARALVVLPTYDERETIGAVLDGLLGLGRRLDVVVVDDASPDGTARLVRERSEADPRIALIERPDKGGLASAYATGFARAIDGGYDLVVEMDSDLSHRPAELARLLDGAARADLVIGSRYVDGGSVSNWSRSRVALSKAGNRYARFCLGLPVRDSTSGFRVFRVEALRTLLREEVSADGYGFQIELAYRAWRDGLTLVEEPITFSEREHGRSKISRRIVVEALWRVTVWGMRARMGRPATSER